MFQSSRWAFPAALFLFVQVAGSTPALAAAGQLDTSFGGDGKVTTHFAKRSFDTGFGVALQSNGKIVAVGFSQQSHSRFALARYNPDGTLDPSFGGDGKVRTHFAKGSFDFGFGVALQSDGKIVAAGSSQHRFFTTQRSHARFALARYNPDGTLDPSFGGDGKVTTHFAPKSNDIASGVAIQSDGRIVAAGASRQPRFRFALARYGSDGTLDPSFGGDGKVRTHFATRSGDYASAVALQANGKILVAGDSFRPRGSIDLFALARYLPS